MEKGKNHRRSYIEHPYSEVRDGGRRVTEEKTHRRDLKETEREYSYRH